ncbi:MAG: TRAP transporter substrate-binding protein [Acetivibrionales bacterium]|jgi:tripartite ATP-independent transporter DctP family solute receptor
MLKRLGILFIVLTLIASILAGCGSSSPNQSASPAPSSNAPVASEKPASEKPKQTIEMSVAAYVNKGTPEVDGLEYLKKILEERSNGQFKVNVFFGGTVGGESDTVEQVRAGTLQLSIGAWDTCGKYAAEYMPWVVPYLFPDTDAIKRSWEGKVGDALRQKMEDNGLIFSGIYFRGNRHLTAKKEIKSVDDVKGLKIRLPGTAAWVEVWKELGCLPAPIPSSEVFGALQTGVVDAQENPVTSNHEKKLWEVQDYMILTNHIVDFNGYFLSKKWFDTLDADTQALVNQALQDALEYTQKLASERESTLLEDLKKQGMKVIDPDIESFRKKAAPATERIKANWADWVYEETLKDIAGK